jgi:hypothetical protein
LTFHEQLPSWLLPVIIPAIIVIIAAVLGFSIRNERRLTRLEDRIKNLEENPVLVLWKDFQNLQARRLFDPEGTVKKWEMDEVKPKLQKRKEKEKDGDGEEEDENTK